MDSFMLLSCSIALQAVDQQQMETSSADSFMAYNIFKKDTKHL